MDINIFRKMSYGVYIVSSLDGERPTGCIANSIMQITSSPATVAVSVNHDNYTNGCIEKTGKFAFSIMAKDSDAGLIGNFGFRSGKDVDKFEHVDYEMVQGIPVVKFTCGYVVCKVINKMETATHTVFLGEVIDAGSYDGMGDAMTYAYYHNVVKGKAPKMRLLTCRKMGMAIRWKMRKRRNILARYAAMYMKEMLCQKILSVPYAELVQTGL